MNLSQQKLFLLIMVTFFLISIFTYFKYNESITFSNQQPIVISESNHNLINYLKPTHKQIIENEDSLIKDALKNIKSTENTDQVNKSQPLNIKQNSIMFNSNQDLVKKSSINLKRLVNKFNNQVIELTNKINKQNQNLLKKNLLIKTQPESNESNESKKVVTLTSLIKSKYTLKSNGGSNLKNLNVTKKPLYIPNPYEHTSEEIDLARRYIIDKKNLCFNDHGYGLDLLVMVVSSPDNFEARKAIRKTWGGLAVERGSKLLFVVGNAPNKSLSYFNSSKQINDLIKEEDNEFEDILQGTYTDAYYNLTLKTISIINWINHNCEKVKYILKVDDDMFINMQLLVDFAEVQTFNNVIIGRIAKKWLPHRNPKSKWYIPRTVYNGTFFPNFATGPAYLISGTAIKGLYNQILDKNTKVIKLEDVFLAGIVAEKAGVKRLNYSLFKNSNIDVNVCNFMHFITSHHYSPQEILHQWDLVYSGQKIDCNALKKKVLAVIKNKTVKKKSEVVKKN